MRHSAAHVMAEAVGELFPGVKYAIGPPIEDGFYYDFELPRPISEEDLPRIEEKMKAIAAQRKPLERSVLPREEAVAPGEKRGPPHKGEVVRGLAPGQEVLFYRQREWVHV